MRDARPCVGSPPWLCVRGSRAAVCAVPVRTALRSRGVLCVTVLCYSVVLLWPCVGAVCVVLPMQCVLRQLMHACHVWAVFLRCKTLSRSLRWRPGPCCLPVAEASVLRSCALVGSVSWRLLESVARRAVTHAVCLWQKRRCFGVLLRMLCGMFVPSAGFSNDLPPMLLALGRGVGASEPCSGAPRAEATVCSSS